MKKILSITLAVLMLSLCFVVTVSADATPIDTDTQVKIATFSEDFQNMFIDGTMYARANTTNIQYYETPVFNEYNEEITDVIDEAVIIDCKLSDEQKKTVDGVEVIYNSSTETIYEVQIYYKDGSRLFAKYLLVDLMNEYNKLINHEFEEYYVDFAWPVGNVVALNEKAIFNQQTRVFDLYESDDTFNVKCAVKGGSLRYSYGELIYIDKEFYFYDPELNPEAEEYKAKTKYTHDFESDKPKVKLGIITDTATKEALDEALQKYYKDDMGYMYNDELLEGVSKVFLTILFAVIPFGAFVAFLVFLIKAKKKTYKKIYLTGCILSLAEVAVFITTAIYLFK